MGNIELGDFEKKIMEILDQKERNIYTRLLERFNFEERRINLIERLVKIEEEQKGQKSILEKLLHQMDKRFEQVDKRFDIMHQEMESRFEQVDKRFDIMHQEMESRFEQVDKRFDIMHQGMESRSEQVDKHFDIMHQGMESRSEQVDKRFEQVDKRFSLLTWVLGIGFTFTVSILVVILNFVLKI